MEAEEHCRTLVQLRVMNNLLITKYGLPESYEMDKQINKCQEQATIIRQKGTKPGIE